MVHTADSNPFHNIILLVIRHLNQTNTFLPLIMASYDFLRSAELDARLDMMDIPEDTPCGPPPPIDGMEFPTYQKAFEFCQAHAKEHGYALMTKDGKPKRRLWTCDREGEPDHKNKRVGAAKPRPNAKSKKCGCKFAMDCKLVKETGKWVCRVLEKDHTGHKGDWTGAASALHRLRSLPKREKDAIFRDFGHNIANGTVLERHNEDSQHQLVPTDIRNLRAEYRRADLDGHSALMALLRDLKERGFWYKYEEEEETHILKYLYICHPKALEVYKTNHEVLLFDCTYKTNKFNMPLLNICGVTGNKKTIQIALCFLPDETEPTYDTALRTHAQMMTENSIPEPLHVVTDRETALMNSLNVIFPSANCILCRWHVNQNVIKNCKKFFPEGETYFKHGRRLVRDHPQWTEFMDAWTGENGLLYAEDEQQYYARLNAFVRKWDDRAVRYCQGWLVFKEKLVCSSLVLPIPSLHTNSVLTWSGKMLCGPALELRHLCH